MKCPSCSTQAAGGECPSCGLIFSKWNQRQERARLKAEEALAALERGSGRPASLDPWRGRILAGAFLAAWLIGLTLAARYYMRTRRIPEGRPVQAGDTVPLRDPATGDIRMMKIQAAAEKPRPRSVAAPEPEAPADARVLRESEWVEEDGRPSAPAAKTKKTILPPPPPGDD